MSSSMSLGASSSKSFAPAPYAPDNAWGGAAIDQCLNFPAIARPHSDSPASPLLISCPPPTKSDENRPTLAVKNCQHESWFRVIDKLTRTFVEVLRRSLSVPSALSFIEDHNVLVGCTLVSSMLPLVSQDGIDGGLRVTGRNSESMLSTSRRITGEGCL